MDIVEALKQEESKLHRQLTAIQGAIAALNDGVERWNQTRLNTSLLKLWRCHRPPNSNCCFR